MGPGPSGWAILSVWLKSEQLITGNITGQLSIYLLTFDLFSLQPCDRTT